MPEDTHAAPGRRPFAHDPLSVVDTTIVATENLDAMLALIGTEMVPVMEAAGATLASCLATSREIGEDVIVQTTWSVRDHAAWNVIRGKCFLDPRWHAMWAKAAALRTGSDRRFFYPAPIGEGA